MRSDELGQSIRAWRDRLDPAEAGLSAGAQRRAPGPRREEPASHASVSVDHLSRLEQGRATNPSPPVRASLARTLRPITVDCDVVTGRRSSPRMIVCSCAAGSGDAEKPALVGAVGPRRTAG